MKDNIINFFENKSIEESSIEEYNNTPVKDFENLTPKEMYLLLYNDFNDTVIRINEYNKPIDKIPIIKQIKYLINKIREKKEIQLTPAGYLPPKLVIELYEQRILTDYDIEIGIIKLKKEIDSESIVTTRTYCEIPGLIKKRQNKLTLTKKCIEIIEKPELLKKIIIDIGKHYNWAFFDGYPKDEIGRSGYQYSFYLIKKFGDKEREDKFYGEKYFKAFPDLINNKYEDCINSYSLRTFDRFMKYFGFVKIREENLEKKYIKKTELFDEYISLNK